MNGGTKFRVTTKRGEEAPRLAKAVSATQAGELPRLSTSSGQNVKGTEERSTFGLIQEYYTRIKLKDFLEDKRPSH